MTQRGKLIVIEGIDGSGKRTQLDLLSAALTARGLNYVTFSFPRYESSFGHLVARFLNGEFGRLDAVDPHFSALLYAGDRFESKPELESALSAGKIILSDRYIASNLAHQTARVSSENRPEFLTWLKGLEYNLYALPPEDLVIYLRLPAARAYQLVARKSTRKYTNLRRDLLEADVHHLELAAAIYDQLGRQPNWVTIECVDTVGAMRPAQEIAPVIWAAVESFVLKDAATVQAAKLSGVPRVS